MSRRSWLTAGGIAMAAGGAALWALVLGPGERLGPADGGVDDSTTGRGDLGGLVLTLDAVQAQQLLEQLPQTGAEPEPGYDRDAYGEAWIDVDGNGCNQRDDTLLRDAVAGTVRVGTQHGCAHDVLAGEWLDPYTGTLVRYEDLKDPAQAQAISIDHVIPLAEAHRSGAAGWDEQRRIAFANDLDNLVAADGSQNASKGDQDPGSWRPPEPVWCAYATVWVSVKHEWELAVDAAEREALEEMLGTC